MKKALLFFIVGIILIGVAVYGLTVQDRRPALIVSEIAYSAGVTDTPIPNRVSPSATNQPTLTPFQPDTPTLTPSPSPTITPTKTPSLTPTASPTPTPLEEAIIKGIRGRWAAYSLDCESRSAVDWAAYFGVSISEIEFFNALPVSDDPDLGFVGNVHSPWGQTPPRSYGVHAGPVADLLQKYGLDAVAVRGMTWDKLRAEISAGRPVIVWVIGHVGRGTPIPFTSSAGRETIVARFEHTVIVTGYTEHQVTVLDGNQVYTRSKNDFLDSWGVLRNMAIVLGE